MIEKGREVGVGWKPPPALYPEPYPAPFPDVVAMSPGVRKAEGLHRRRDGTEGVALDRVMCDNRGLEKRETRHHPPAPTKRNIPKFAACA